MDGGRRLLRSLKETPAVHSAFASAPRIAAAAAAAIPAPGSAALPTAPSLASSRPRTPTARAADRKGGAPRFASRTVALAARPGVGFLAALIFFAIVGVTGYVQNGGYADLVARHGALCDILMRAAGFSVRAVTITGQSELREPEILATAGVGPRSSLLLLDVAAVRERLLALPLVKSARVLKLYPDRLVIAIEERRPYALWQRDGQIAVVAADGTVIDELRDDRFLGLPFVVGEGAETRLAEFARLVAAAGDLGPRIKAGILVAGRRWTLDMTNGVAVKLPELDPEGAVSTLARLQREARILDKDILSVDLRTPDRVAVRLTEEGVATRAAMLARKSHRGGQT